MRHETIYSFAWDLASAAILAGCGLGTIVLARELTLQDF